MQHSARGRDAHAERAWAPDWGPAPSGATYLVTACHAARQRPLQQLTTEDVRSLIGQNVGLQFLIPLALERLRDNPFSQGDFYPGDLFNAVLTVDPGFWQANRDLAYEVGTILDELNRAIARLHEPAALFRAADIANPS